MTRTRRRRRITTTTQVILCKCLADGGRQKCALTANDIVVVCYGRREAEIGAAVS